MQKASSTRRGSTVAEQPSLRPRLLRELPLPHSPAMARNLRTGADIVSDWVSHASQRIESTTFDYRLQQPRLGLSRITEHPSRPHSTFASGSRYGPRAGQNKFPWIAEGGSKARTCSSSGALSTQVDNCQLVQAQIGQAKRCRLCLAHHTRFSAPAQ